MIKVECPGCKAPYQVDERRVPDAGLKMRCPKCATSFVVTKPGAQAAPPQAAAPKPAAPPAQKPAPAAAKAPAPAPKPPAPAQKAPPPAPKAPPKLADEDVGDEWDLPAPTGRTSGAPGAPPPVAKRSSATPAALTDDDDDVDLPMIAPRGPSAPRAAAKAPPPAQKASGGRGFGEIDLLVDLPAPSANDSGEHDLDLPVTRDASAPKAPGAPPPVARPIAPAGKPGARAVPPATRNTTQLFGDTVPDPAATPQPGATASAPIKVPVPARGAKAAPARAPSADLDPPKNRGAAEIDDDGVDLPQRSTSSDFGRGPFGSSPDLGSRAPLGSSPDRGSRPSAEPKAPSPRASSPGARGPDAPRAAAPPPAKSPEPLGFGEIDLPLLASEADLPAPGPFASLPIAAAGLPVPAAGLPTPIEGGALPARPAAGLPMAAAGTTLPLAAGGTTLPVRMQRTPTPMGDRLDRLSAPDFDGSSTGRASSPFAASEADGPAVHGPGHVAGADLYTGPAAYDERHMDPAFQTSGRDVGKAQNRRPTPITEVPEEAPLMTTSGAMVGRRASDQRTSNSDVKLGRAPSHPSMGDLIDRTSIELDLIDPGVGPAGGPSAPQNAPPLTPATPAQISSANVPLAQRVPTPPVLGAPLQTPAMQRVPTPLSVPDLAESPDEMPRPAPRFDDDPLNDPSSGVFASPDAGTEASLGADDVGDEADLDGKSPGGRAAPTTKSAPKAESKDDPPKKKPWLKIVIGVAVAGLFAGAMAGFVPDIGPFGLNFVSDRVNAKLQNDALDTMRGIIQSDMEPDTSAGADRALAKVKTAQAAYPRHRATAGYAAFIALSRGLRFGARPEDRAYGDMMVRASTSRPSDFLLMAQAAQDATTGQIARARQTCQGLLERRPDDVDVAVLAGEVELLARAVDTAPKVWQRAVDIKKSPRSLFGLARAQFAANDMIGAEASAKSALEMSPKHVGARTLLASIVWRNGAREQQALELLTKVTEDNEIRSSAGEPELVAAYTELGNIHLAKSRMTQAEQAFAAALKIDPQAVNALVGNGELFYRSGRYSEAVARYEAATRADAESIPAKIGMAKTLLFLERAKDAKDMLKKLAEQRPNEPLAFYWLGRAEEMLGNKKEAEASYAAAIKVGGDQPQTVEAYVALAQLLSSLGRIDDANARLAEAGNRFPGLPALHRARGDVALATGNYAEAKKEYEAALGREDDLGTKFRLGSTLRRMRQFEDAASLFDAIAESDKDFPGLALERGLLFEETGQSERATEMYAKALQSAPNDLDLKLRVGSTQVMAGHAKQAEAILRDVLKAKPNSAEVNHFLGRALLLRGGPSLGEAKRFLERASEIDPNRAEYHLYVGWVANEVGDTTLAESALKRTIELDRNLGDAYWQRAVLLQKQGQSLDALNDLKIALEKSPSRFEIYATMAFCYQDQSRWPEAEEAWRKAIAGNDQNPDWHYRLGKTQSIRGNKALSTAEFDKAVTLAEAPDKPIPNWLAEAHFNLGEAYRAMAKDKAKKHFERYLQLARQNDPLRADAEKALQGL